MVSWINPATLLTSLISAVIAGLVVAFMSHRWNRNRAKEDWLRSQLFELISDLMDANREFGRACQKLRWDSNGNKFIWEPMEEAVGLYTDAVAKISLLMTANLTMQVLLDLLKGAYTSVAIEAKQVSTEHTKEIIQTQDLAPYMEEPLAELHISFQSVREFITRQYLLSRKDRKETF